MPSFNNSEVDYINKNYKKNGLTPLHCAAKNGRLESVNFIMERCDENNPIYIGVTPLHFAKIILRPDQSYYM